MKNKIIAVIEKLKEIIKIKKSIVIIGIFLVLIVSMTVFSFLNQESHINKFITYYNGISSLIIMLLTLAYVFTTNGQLTSMRKQLKLMDKSVNLQVQPLPVPNIERIYLEKVNAYLSPETKFSLVEVIYRLHCNLNFSNAGNGAALNVSAYTTIVCKERKGKRQEGNTPYTSPSCRQIYCVSDKSDTKDLSTNFMFLDANYKILDTLINGIAFIKIEIYYKNIFGAGFYEQVKYKLLLSNEDKEKAKDWLKFINDFRKRNIIDFKRHKALALTVPDDADTIFNKVREELQEFFNEDLEIQYYIEPESFSVQIIDFDTEVHKAQKNHLEKFDEFVKGTQINEDNKLLEEVAVTCE